MKTIIMILFLCVITFGNKRIEKLTYDRSILVRNYYEQAFKLNLPLTWQNTSNKLPVEEDNIKYLSKGDTLLLGSDAAITRLLGVLPDTSEVFTFLLAYPADDVMPMLVTLDKNGNRISSKILGYGCGGADCGFYCMNGIFIIENKNSFYSTQEAYTVDCDPDLDTKDTTTLVFRKVRTKGQINKQGKITFNKEEILEERKVNWNSGENPFAAN